MGTTFRLEAIEILEKAKKPLSIDEITKEFLRRKKVRTRGATPKATLHSMIVRDINKKGEKSIFIKTHEGLFALK